jgi:hypothetical protein
VSSFFVMALPFLVLSVLHLGHLNAHIQRQGYQCLCACWNPCLTTLCRLLWLAWGHPQCNPYMT